MTLSGDDNGLHVLVADASSAYQWRTAATLSEPGFDTDQWIGQSCVTSSGQRAVVVYAPRQFTNESQFFDEGSFAAIVDLTTGAVDKLPFTASLAYYDPGCGAGEQVALSTLSTGGDKTASVVRVIDAATGKTLRQTTSAGQLSSPVPYDGGVVAALGDRLVSVDAKGGEHTVTTEAGTAFRLHPDAGGLAYEVPVGNQVQVRRLVSGRSSLVGTAALSGVQLVRSGARVFLLGPDAGKIKLPAGNPGGWTALDAPVGSEPSTTGALVVTDATNHVDLPSAGLGSAAPAAKDIPDTIAISAKVIATGRNVSFQLAPQAVDPEAGQAASPALGGFGGPAKSGGAASGTASPQSSPDPGTVPWDPDRGCSVPRNDPSIQTYQATAQQVEWAADLAVQGQLKPSRAANWQGSGMPVSWTPQGMFPLRPINGGGQVPAQVLLGVLAQESNTLQASPHAVDAITGNFNQGGFYGNQSDWSTVDCGYGVGQVTTGMAMSTPAGTPVADGNMAYTTAQQQQAIATDYASNIAATLNILIDKWNQVKAAGIVAGDGNPAYVENWYFAVWAYNSGVQPASPALGNPSGCTPGPNCTDTGGAGGNWGMGWSNNPANPKYPADRGTFVDSTADTKVPNHWSYPELVMGWAYSPVPRFNYSTGKWGPAYAIATGNGAPVIPPFMYFCTPANDNCTPDGAADSNGIANTAGLCNYANLHCWWHIAANWVTCTGSGQCGTSNLTYSAGSTPPLGHSIYPADCRALGTSGGSASSDSTDAAPPAGSIVVDDVTTPSAATCNQTWTDQGSFGLGFAKVPSGCGCSQPIDYPGKIDFHQVGLGFGGHIWFSHTVPASNVADTVVGTWTPPALNGWVRVLAHIPDNGDFTQQAPYTVTTGAATETRYVNTDMSTNEWVSLGVFQFNSSAGPQNVSLTNATPDGDGSVDIAWDAVAFQPLSAKPANFVVQMGDSYSSGEGAEPYLPGTDVGPYADQQTQTSPGESWNACRRSQNSWIRKTVLPGQTATIGAQSDSLGNSLDYHSTACSGAYTWEMDPALGHATNWGTVGEHHEVQQLASGYLDANTTLVTLTIGGDDAGFSSILQACATFDSCPSQSTVDGNIAAAIPKIETVLEDIAQSAPNAKIVLLGYPDLFDGNGGLNCSTIMSAGAIGQLNTMSDDLATAESNAVKSLQSIAVPVVFAPAEPAFAGYEDCGATANGINDFVAAPTGPGDFSCPVTPDPRTWLCVSMESFHPNNIGTTRYALALESALG